MSNNTPTGSKPTGSTPPDSKQPVERDPALRSDRFITWVMLGFAIVTVGSSLAQYTNMVQTLSEMYQQFGAMDATFTLKRYPDTEFATLIGQIMMTVDAAILGFVVWWSMARMNSNRRAFWVPVIGWLASTLASSILIAIAFAHDPAFVPTFSEWMRHIAENGLPTPTPAG